MLREICQVMPADELGTVILAVNDTAVSSEFMRQLSNSKNTLLVADEVHALGSHENSKIMEKDFAFRLGLSATPERYRDPEGTQKLFNFFNGIVKPEVSLMDALRAGRLVPYNYFPLLTYLSADEEEAWISLTNKIINYLRMNEIDSTSFNKDTRLSSMLINRARIAKKATSKVSTVIETILENYNEGEHWLIYCEDRYQLGEINDQIADSDINTFIYMSNMEGSAQGELDAFTRQSGILLSIRCLDEGVDIPKISHAIIAASSQNPRQFIQRRGRVLRKTEGKLNAVIYDCIVVPENSTDETKFDGLIVSEVRRAIEFAQTARNSSYADSTLRNILISVGSDPDSVMDEIDGDREIEY
jgi:superfamily II DNA or RNA helicase